MKCTDGIWFPDHETHLLEMLEKGPKVDGRGTYILTPRNFLSLGEQGSYLKFAVTFAWGGNK